MNVREEIVNKIVESVKEKVYEAYDNQATRMIDLRAKYLVHNTRHCEIWNDFKIDPEKKKQMLEEHDKTDPRKGILKYEYEMLREQPDDIKKIYRKHADQFLKNIGRYVE